MNRIINIPKIILDKNGPSLPYNDFFWIFSIILSSSSLLNDKTENHNTEDNNTNLNVNELTKINGISKKNKFLSIFGLKVGKLLCKIFLYYLISFLNLNYFF